LQRTDENAASDAEIKRAMFNFICFVKNSQKEDNSTYLLKFKSKFNEVVFDIKVEYLLFTRNDDNRKRLMKCFDRIVFNRHELMGAIKNMLNKRNLLIESNNSYNESNLFCICDRKYKYDYSKNIDDKVNYDFKLYSAEDTFFKVLKIYSCTSESTKVDNKITPLISEEMTGRRKKIVVLKYFNYLVVIFQSIFNPSK
jgi:hypothetical protein